MDDRENWHKNIVTDCRENWHKKIMTNGRENWHKEVVMDCREELQNSTPGAWAHEHIDGLFGKLKSVMHEQKQVEKVVMHEQKQVEKVVDA